MLAALYTYVTSRSAGEAAELAASRKSAAKCANLNQSDIVQPPAFENVRSMSESAILTMWVRQFHETVTEAEAALTRPRQH